jgi:hypothetical protein
VHSRTEINKSLKEFENICSNVHFGKPTSITKAPKHNHDFKLNVENPKLRGIYLEEALLLKIIKYK